MSSKCVHLVLVTGVLVAGTLCAVLVTPRAQAQPATEQQLASRSAMLDVLEARIEGIEAVRAIERLQYAYGHYVEFGLWNDFADLFTENADTNYQQGAHNKEAIRKLFFEQVGQGRLGLADGRIYPHILFQPVVTLGPDGRTAKGRWRILAMLGGMGGSATWYSGVYENEYTLDGGVWKISLLRSEPRATAAYTAKGWRDSGVHIPMHYSAEDLTQGFGDAGRGTPERATTFQALAVRVQQLEQRAARLNDQAAVTNLQDDYGYAIDRKEWDQAVALFADDGTLELGQRGVYVGKASIRRGLNQFGTLAEDEIFEHVYLQTLVTVAAEGRTAKARGVEIVFANVPEGELREGVFENTFVKQDGSWKIQSVHTYPRMIVDAHQGWARSAKPAPGLSTEVPPDRPPTARYEIYPKFSVPLFHFDNPVTGKAPQYPEGVVVGEAARVETAGAEQARAIRDDAEMEARLASLTRSVAVAEAYDVTENLINAYGYYLDESPDGAAELLARPERVEAASVPRGTTVFANQTMQPVIDVSFTPEGAVAKFRARRLDLGGASGEAGYWSAGLLEGEVSERNGVWKFDELRASSRWGASYPGGWWEGP